MIIRRMALNNFRCFDDQIFEFPNGVLGILGPNGSGKSTVLEAISWGLYGSSTLRTNRDELTYDGASASADCGVRMEFQLEGQSYQLERKMTGKSLSSRAQLVSEGETLAESFQGVTKYVKNKLLQMKEDSFFRSVFSKQNEVRQLSSGGPEQRRQLFAKLLDIDRIKEARKKVDLAARDKELESATVEEQLGDLEGLENRLLDKIEERTAVKTELSSLEDRLDEIRQKIEEKEKRYSKLEDLKETRSELVNTSTRLETEIDNLQGNVEERREELQSLKEKREEAERLEGIAQKYERLKKRRKELEEEKDRFHRREKLLSDLEQIQASLEEEREKLERTRERIEEYEGVEEKLQEVEEGKQDIEEEIEELKGRTAQLEAKRANYENEIEKLRDKLDDVEELGEEGQCPVCTRTLGEDYDTVTEHFREEIVKLQDKTERLEEEKLDLEEKLERKEENRRKLSKRKNQLEQHNQDLKTLEAKREDLEKRISSLQEQRRDTEGELEEVGVVDFDEDEYEEVKAKLEGHEEDYERYKQLKQDTARIPQLEQRIDQDREALGKRKAELANLRQKIEELEFDKDQFQKLRGKLKELRKDKDVLQEEASEKGKQLADLTNDVDHLREEIREEKKMRKKLDELREDRLQLERTSKLLDSFREDLLARIRPVLSRRASHLLERTTNGRYRKLDIDSDYMVNIYEDGEPYRLDRFSGGETDLVNLCLRISISELVAKRSGRAINFLVLDEVFGSQDQQRRRNILQALRSLDDLFAQIFVITHAENIKDRMENVFLLSREDQGPTDVEPLLA